jgi:hypothetical protein
MAISYETYEKMTAYWDQVFPANAKMNYVYSVTLTQIKKELCLQEIASIEFELNS